LYEIGDEYLVTAELPGCVAEDLDLSVANGIVTIRGTRTAPGKIPEESYRRSERSSGNWERSISVPERIEDDKIRAELTDGLLKLSLPKAPSAVRKQIHIAGSKSSPHEIGQQESLDD